ncbi:hypothetical protein D3C78_1538230 [compost metagenome]
MMAGGVPAGASRPSQNFTLISGKPAWAIVGTSGICASRSFDVTASAFSFPERICGTLASVSNELFTSPAMTARLAWDAAL